jgi:phosphate-selective porin OprO/OprP
MSYHWQASKRKTLFSYYFTCLVFLPFTIFAEEEITDIPVLNQTGIIILINNVTLQNPANKKENSVANILIKDGLLELITQDNLNDDTIKIEIDAKKGFLLGNLELGEAPSFLILTEDPHKNIKVLLDTKKYANFAVHQGLIIKNELVASKNIIKTKPKKAAWLAYNPPTFVLPTSFKTKQWNIYKGKYLSSLFIGTIALDRQYWTSQNDESHIQVGDLTEYEGGEIRALRFGVVGTLNFDKPWVYNISGATNAFDKGFDSDNTDSFSLLDWRLDIPTYANTTLSIGKQKEPISMERLMPLIYLPMQERSVVADTLLPSRNIGMVLSGSSFNQQVTWAGGVFNNWLEQDWSFGDNATQLVGRTTWLPYISEDESELLHLGFGLRYSNAQEVLRFSSGPEFNNAPRFIDSDFLTAKKSLTYNLEASWRKGPLWLSSEYLTTNVETSQYNDPTLSGYYLSAAYSLTGEMRNYNKRSGTFNPLSVGRGVEDNGFGAWELTSRWSVFDGNDGGLESGKTEIFSLGVFWWLSPKFSLSMNYRWITLERCSFLSEFCDLEGQSNGFNTRLILML